MAAGEIECSVKLKPFGIENFDTPIYSEWQTYTIKTAADANPATGTNAPAAAAVIALFGAAVLTRKRRK